jgi:tRNA dimethylallyltransferase
VKIGVSMERPMLYRRIDERVVRFFDAGLIDEVRDLLARGVPPDANAFKALGYREALACLDGRLTRAEAVALTQRRTRRYAKRQWTWFRREAGVRWFTVGPGGVWDEPLAYAAGALGMAS